MLKGDKDRPTAEDKVVLVLGTEIFELNTTTGSLVGSLQELKPRVFDTKRDLKKDQETAAVSDSHH